MTANVHCLLHLPEVVKEQGPLYVTSCFSFEALNGQLLNLMKGTQGIAVQIARAINTIQTIPLYASKYLEYGSDADKLYKKISKYSLNQAVHTGGISVVGCPQQLNAHPLLHQIQKVTNCLCAEIQVYARISLNSR